MRLFADQTHRRCAFTMIALLVCSFATIAQDKKKAKDKPVPDTPTSKPGAINRMDYGPAIAYTIKSATDKNNIAYKGLAIGLGEKKNGEYQAAMIYDLDTMRVLAGSVGGHLNISKINYSSYKGNDIASVAGKHLFGTKPGPGWANPKTGKWDDPRAYRNGPLPGEWVKYRGHLLIANKVELHYAIAGTQVIEKPSLTGLDTGPIFRRTIEIAKSKHPLAIRLHDQRHEGEIVGSGHADFSNSNPLQKKKLLISIEPPHQNEPRLWTIVYGVPDKAKLKIEDNRRLVLHLPPSTKTTTITVIISRYPEKPEKAFEAALEMLLLEGFDSKSAPDAVVEKALGKFFDTKTKKGPPTETGTGQDGNALVALAGTQGKPTNKSAYVLDNIPVPLKNPHNSWMRLTGFDFFADGKRAAVCTWNGDVWIVSGIDDDLKNVTWHRYASGLFEPLGIAIVDDEVYALGRDRLTKLHDKNKDGVADFYENFNSDFPTYPRAITTELQVDSGGNFYFQKNGNRTPSSVPMHGSILRVSKDGSKADIAVHGIRSANGMGIGLIGREEVLGSSDQEGNWTPASRIDFLRHGQYVGYKPHAHTKGDSPDGAYKRPVCWLPKDVDNSPGGLAYIADDRWGPYKGNWIATSYGQCKLFLLMHQTEQWTQPKDYDPRNASETITQGGVVTFPLNFGTGIHRARFNKRDGQLYVLGLKGWQTKGAIDGGFYRVRYTGKPALLPAKVEALSKGVRLTFATKLDRELAEDLESFEVKRWNYQYTKKYGSPEFSVADPEKKGRDSVTVRKAELAKDGKTITLYIDDMKPVMQMMIKYDLETANGDVMRNAVYHTVHVLGGK